MISQDKLKLTLSTLPEQPGVYKYFNINDEIIYVGKAKNLKKRVSSYFNKTQKTRKTEVLVKNIERIEYIIVGSEADALLLENNLIKEYQPRYNAMLKDGKTYPSICITNEAFPRVFKTRDIKKGAGEYFGPFSSAHTINSLLDIISRLYPIRNCRLALTKESIAEGKFKLCLQYHIHKCNAPCEGKESQEDYLKHIEHVREILRGNAKEIEKQLYKEMKKLASEQRYEEAHLLKQKYELIEKYTAKSIIANTVLENTDVFAYDENEQTAFVNILRISKGTIVQGFTVEYKKLMDEDKTELLSRAIIELREQLNSNSKEIIIPFDIGYSIKGVKISIPQRGDRKKLLELAEQNVKEHKIHKLKQAEKLNPEHRAMQALKEIQASLKMEKIPMRIEAFDNSNIQGSDPVAACVVFIKGKPSKKDYRKYTIKTVRGVDDYASMKEVVRRRYSKMKEEESALPDLIVCDGGKGQMEVVRQVVEDELNLKIEIAGLVKDEKHRTKELLFGFPPKEIGLKLHTPLFKLLASIQEEAHRFAIKFHREKRSKGQISSELDTIKGIGEKTKNELIRQFKSIKRIKTASLEELSKNIGNNRASIVYGYFKDEKKR